MRRSDHRGAVGVVLVLFGALPGVLLILAARRRDAQDVLLRASHDAGFTRGYEARSRDLDTAAERPLRAVDRRAR
jgi:hypothetical protein